MKEQLHTIPISDAMANAGECPFCYIEQKTEEHMMDFVLGPVSYTHLTLPTICSV